MPVSKEYMYSERMKDQENDEYINVLSPQAKKRITLQYLEGLKPGYQEIEIFEQLARLAGLSTVEVLPIRASPQKSGKVEVLLVRRSADEPFWPNLLHVAGSIIREDDAIEHSHDYRPAISRAIEEIGGVVFAHDPVELETIHHRSYRSREVIIRFWAEVSGEPSRGEFYDAEDILNRASTLGLLDSHVEMIKQVVAAYQSSIRVRTE